MAIALQAFGPYIYDSLNRLYWIRCCSGSLIGTAENWNDPYETGWTDFAAQPNKMRIAYNAGNVLDRPYGNFAWQLMTYGHLAVFGLPLALSFLALQSESPSMAFNALYWWYLCYDVAYPYLVFGVSSLFYLMMDSSWRYYVLADSMDIASVGYDMHDQAKTDLFFYWASQATFISLANNKAFRSLRAGLNEAAKALETDEDDSTRPITVDDIDNDDGSINF